jgi:hypothetical protein
MLIAEQMTPAAVELTLEIRRGNQIKRSQKEVRGGRVARGPHHGWTRDRAAVYARGASVVCGRARQVEDKTGVFTVRVFPRAAKEFDGTDAGNIELLEERGYLRHRSSSDRERPYRRAVAATWRGP